MLIIRYLTFVSSVLLGKVSSFAKENHLYVLDESNYDDFIRQNPSNIVFLNSTVDCHICADAYKVVNEVATNYNKETSESKVGIVKCDHSSALCRRLSSKKPPVLFISIRGEHVYFSDMYSSRNVIDFIEKRTKRGIAQYHIDTFEKDKIVSDRELKVIAIIKEDASESAKSVFRDLSKYELEDIFMTCSHDKCMSYFSNGTDTVYLLNNKRKAFRIGEVQDFHHLINDFFAFKNPFVIDFETEFRKRVLEEMTPTLIYLTDKNEDDEDRVLFEKVIEKYNKNMLACIIETNNLSPKSKKIYAELIDLLDLENVSYPLVTYVEPNMETLTLTQYRYNGELDERPLRDYLTSLFSGSAVMYIRYEKKHPSFEKNIPVLNGLNFKTHVFVNEKESVILVHRGFDKCDVSRRYLDHVSLLSKESEFRTLFFAVVNGNKNDLPIYIERLPAILVFTKNSWEYPIVFADSPNNLSRFNKILRDRKKMVFDVKDPEELNVFDEL